VNKVTAKVDSKIVEFLLDLPTDFSMVDIKMEDGKVVVVFETELEIPAEVSLEYSTDEYGNIAMTGLGV
jgi:hypothetical protein